MSRDLDVLVPVVCWALGWALGVLTGVLLRPLPRNTRCP